MQTPSEHSVEMAAGNVMGAAVIFLLLQVPVMILFMVCATLLPGLGILSPTVGERLGIALGLVAEVMLVVFLVRMVRRNVGKSVVSPSPSPVDPAQESAALERRLERLMMAGAILGIVCTLLMGLGSFGAKVALTVIEAFAALFLLLTITTRWFLTRKVSTWGVAALAAILFSFGLAAGFIRG